MIIPDVNILLYAFDDASPFHETSKTWWEHTVNEGETIGLPWVVILGFLRITTHPKVLKSPLSVEQAIGIIESWLQIPSLTIVEPRPGHARIFFGLLKKINSGNKIVTDAHLAAIACEHRAVLVTNDRDFERFSGVLLLNPLEV